jgi:hypothetical protein
LSSVKAQQIDGAWICRRRKSQIAMMTSGTEETREQGDFPSFIKLVRFFTKQNFVAALSYRSTRSLTETRYQFYKNGSNKQHHSGSNGKL